MIMKVSSTNLSLHFKGILNVVNVISLWCCINKSTITELAGPPVATPFVCVRNFSLNLNQALVRRNSIISRRLWIVSLFF